MHLKNISALAFAVGLLLSAGLPTHADTRSADVIVYGSTPGGVCAAIAAAREGASVILLEPTRHVGGMNTGGLSFSDSNQMYRQTLMGLFHEWHLRIQEDYERRGIELPYDVNVKDQTNWSYEPHVASRVTHAMLDEADVTVLTERHIESVETKGERITGIVTSDGVFSARMFIDGSYEGDLMAAAGVSWRIGRESRDEYGESYAGRQYPKKMMEIDGFDDEGNPLPLITATQRGPDDIGDDELMVYSFRLPLTNKPGNKIQMPKPDNYDPARFEVVRRYVRRHGARSVGFDRYRVPNGKRDGNNSIGRQFSIGLVGGATGWAEADQAERARIFEAHRQYTLEFIHFLSTDPVFSEEERAEVAQWGLCADEFEQFDCWPPQLYVRESRRLEGMYVVTQSDILDENVKADPIVVASFPIDSHDCRRIAIPGGGVTNEGTIFPVRRSGVGYPYHVPYRAIVPKVGQCDNLLVPVALSSTHVAISSLRIEATWMLLGQSAGIAAAMAAEQDVSVQALPYEDLEPRLLAQGQVLTLPKAQKLEGIVLDDADAELIGDWKTSTSFSSFVGESYLYTGAPDTPHDGSASATFRFTAPESGTYKLNMAYSPHPTRADSVPLTITSGSHVTDFVVDQTIQLPPASLVREIGKVELVASEETVITVDTEGTAGFIILDAIELVRETP